MQSNKSQVFPVRRLFALSLLLFVGALLWSITPKAQAQIAVQGHTQSGVSMDLKSKGGGQADITVTGVSAKQSLSYCLVGVGRGQWHAKNVDGTPVFDTTKIACAKTANNAVTVTVKLATYDGGRVIGYVPVVVDANGRLVSWQPYPMGSQKFEKNDGKFADIIAVYFAADGSVRFATAAEALTIND